jgi:hypothetical protein
MMHDLSFAGNESVGDPGILLLYHFAPKSTEPAKQCQSSFDRFYPCSGMGLVLKIDFKGVAARHKFLPCVCGSRKRYP